MRRGRVLLGAAGCSTLVVLAWLWQGRPARYGEIERVAVTPDSSPSSAYRLEQVAITTTTGRRVNCTLRLPARPLAPRSLLGVLLLGGIGTGRHAATLVGREFGGLVLSCDYPWRDPTTFSTLHFLAALPAIRSDILGTPDALGVAASYLLSRVELDSSRLAGVGASLGVPPISAWASADRRASAVALVMGGADLAAIFEANLGAQVRWRALRRPVAALLAWLLRPLEPARTLGRVAPRPVLVIGALGDERIPRGSTYLLYAAAGEPRTLQWFGGRHMLPRDTTLLGSITDSTLAWVSRHLPMRR